MDQRSIGRRIRIARRDRGLTGEQFAELCGINPTYLRQLEGGSKTPSLPLFVSLCNTLKVSPNYLLADVTENNETQGIEILAQIYQTGTPRQIKLITAMVRGALDMLEAE